MTVDDNKLHTCTKHKYPAERCYKDHKCRCPRCSSLASEAQSRRRSGQKLPSTSTRHRGKLLTPEEILRLQQAAAGVGRRR